VSTTEELLDRKVAAPVYITENTAVGIRHADHVAPSIRKSWQSLRRHAADGSVGIVRSRTQTMEFSLVFLARNFVQNSDGQILASASRIQKDMAE
jgi:hypothetical protein